jgi:hypothetical protein
MVVTKNADLTIRFLDISVQLLIPIIFEVLACSYLTHSTSARTLYSCVLYQNDYIENINLFVISMCGFSVELAFMNFMFQVLYQSV